MSDDQDDGAGWEQQEQNEAMRWHEDQVRREAEAFEQLMEKLWGRLRSQWQTNLTEKAPK